ncbi:DNA replication complex GINS protein PSF3 [Spatholobus suberectus]|nr:DNA replication complex GINS protein PSF3 [Spatholobus suberectus]
MNGGIQFCAAVKQIVEGCDVKKCKSLREISRWITEENSLDAVKHGGRDSKRAFFKETSQKTLIYGFVDNGKKIYWNEDVHFKVRKKGEVSIAVLPSPLLQSLLIPVHSFDELKESVEAASWRIGWLSTMILTILSWRKRMQPEFLTLILWFVMFWSQTVLVIFQKAASGVGIDPSSETDFIETGSKVELPFWLAHELQLRQAVSVNVPSCFNQKTREEIQADSAGVDLRSRCPFFYEFGCKIAPIVGDRTIGFLLLSAFKSRYKEIVTKAHSVAFAAGSKFWTILTKEEINMYETAQSAMASFKKWRMGGPRFQIASVLGRKRKSTE